MSAITWSGATFSGTPDDADKRAAHYLVRQENARRAALDPPGTPLDSTPAAALKASVLTIATQTLDGWWASISDQAPRSEDGLTDADKRQILANIRTRLDGGESIASIITDTAGQ
tara:strand:+ start:2429 stop:2773 length:345 start_codon:yes stop_codon:yes gene_type:complete